MLKKLVSHMKKKGQAEIIGIVVLIIFVAVSSIGGYKIVTHNRYVGDLETKEFYDLAKCDVKDIPRENIISFKNVEEARKNGYLPAKCSQQ